MTCISYNAGTTSEPGDAPTSPALADPYVGGVDMPEATCSVPDCTEPVQARGWCGAHYGRWYRHGDPLGGTPSTETRFWSHVEKTETCWLWTGTLNPKGYGCFSVDGRTRIAHRLAYEFVVGSVPDGLQLDHLCRVRRCVNPEHLEPVTGAENQRRGLVNQNAPKTHCPKGHPYEAYSIFETRTQRPRIWRRCTTCRDERKRGAA